MGGRARAHFIRARATRRGNQNLIYADRLSGRMALFLLRERLAGRLSRGTKLEFLEAPRKARMHSILVGWLALIGITASEAGFFAGRLYSANGEPVRPLSRRIGFSVGFESAREIVASSPYLTQMNARWKRDTVTLFVGRTLWMAAADLALRVLCADALSRATKSKALLFAHWPAELPLSARESFGTDVELRLVGYAKSEWSARRAGALAWFVRNRIRRSAKSAPAPAQPETRPALLLLQEDDIAFDRSYRSQPHWLDPENPPSFRTLVLRTTIPGRVDLSPDEMSRASLNVISAENVDRAVDTGELGAALRRDAARSSMHAITTRNLAASRAAVQLARLAGTAEELAALCIGRGVRAFLTGESYMRQADAMQLIAGPLGITTLAWQYSCLPYPSLALVSTCDRMITFAPMFHSRFTWPGLTAPQFVDTGYAYDSAFERVRPRALQARERMRTAGATFVVGLFDESVQFDKFGLVDVAEYEAHLSAILSWLSATPDAGLILKTQFTRHLGLVSAELQEELKKAEASGRLTMPTHGGHRNNVYPAEVAMSSDITIGYAIGTTASTEAALAGCRSLIINEHSLVTDADEIFAGRDIVYTSLAAALTAIDRFRAGDEERRSLGDWTPILHHFDPFRDGRAADRLVAAIGDALGVA